jgi:biopolymer transport protein TolQ
MPALPVQLVMLLLLFASVASWVIILRKKRVLDRAEKEADRFEETFWSGAELPKLYANATERSRDIEGLEAIFEGGMREFNRIRQRRGVDARMQLEGAQRGMRAAASRELDGLERNLEFLANVGSISPYVGLFGTVWGIMISFQGLATMKEATIATVAPGISEALIATAMGLFAAIPAVWAYNRYATRSSAWRCATRLSARSSPRSCSARPTRTTDAWRPHRSAGIASASSRPRSTSFPTST